MHFLVRVSPRIRFIIFASKHIYSRARLIGCLLSITRGGHGRQPEFLGKEFIVLIFEAHAGVCD